MKKEIYVGKNNSTFQHIEVIKNNRYKRQSHKEIFIEGVRNINLALKYKWKIKNWIYVDYSTLSNWAKEKVDSIETEINYKLSAELMLQLSGKNNTSELLAIAEMKAMTVSPSENPCIIVFDRPSKKGNLGSIIRSADAFGCDGVIVTGHCVDIYDPEVIGASMGSYFALDIEKIESNNDFLVWARDIKQKYPNLKIIATSEKGQTNLRSFDFSTPVILLVGNENAGLSHFFNDIADVEISIPMMGEASSFNVACATSIFLYEIFAQRNL